MSLLSPLLRVGGEGRLAWWCPGCDGPHEIAIGEGAGPRWGWNGSIEQPTFTPSVLVTGSGLTAKGQADADAWFAAGNPKPTPKFEAAATVCHSFVVNGQMQMLGDCTHALAGKTVPILPWEAA